MPTRAVLLVNLGSPDSPTEADVRRYLREFLMDGRVLDAPWPIRFCVVHFTILPSRPRESAHAYSKIWTEDGSPLIVTSRHVREKLQERLTVPVELAMRYQNPSIEHAVRSLADQGVTETFLIPLFPHYAMSSYETAVERVKEVARRVAPGMTVEVMPPYYDHPDYIEALVASARGALAAEHDHVLFSFHGLPERHMRKADPTGHHCLTAPNCCETPSPAHETCYRAQCFKTVRAFVAGAGIPAGTYSVSFQSRLGREPWMQPYTDEELVRLAHSGIRRLVVLCPAFVADCLETLEEIGIRGRETFLGAGGTSLTLVPCMNEHARWIEALQGMVAARWPDAPGRLQ
jgi:ferrochelatase